MARVRLFPLSGRWNPAITHQVIPPPCVAPDRPARHKCAVKASATGTSPDVSQPGAGSPARRSAPPPAALAVQAPQPSTYGVLTGTVAAQGLQRQKALNGALKIFAELMLKPLQHFRADTRPLILRGKTGRRGHGDQFLHPLGCSQRNLASHQPTE